MSIDNLAIKSKKHKSLKTGAHFSSLFLHTPHAAHVYFNMHFANVSSASASASIVSTTSTVSTVIAGTALYDDDDTADMRMELSDTAASQLSSPPTASSNTRTVDARRFVVACIKNLFRFCNLDKRLRVTLKTGVRNSLGVRGWHVRARACAFKTGWPSGIGKFAIDLQACVHAVIIFNRDAVHLIP
jgi:hypothetical protein